MSEQSEPKIVDVTAIVDSHPLLDEDDFLYIKDRKKDIVIRGGENIACLEVEAAITEHPAVLEASVFGVPDERLGEKLGISKERVRQIEHEALGKLRKVLLTKTDGDPRHAGLL